MDDENLDDDVTPRWWLDHDYPEHAARMLSPGSFVRTSAEEHVGLARELQARGLVAVYDQEQGGTWAWNPRDLADIAPAGPPPGVATTSSMTAELEQGRRAAKRGSPAGQPARTRSSR